MRNNSVSKPNNLQVMPFLNLGMKSINKLLREQIYDRVFIELSKVFSTVYS